MTQNVKNSRSFRSATRGLAALLWLGVVAIASATGCGSDPPAPAPSVGASGAGGKNDPATGQYTACEVSSECDEEHGFSCVSGECTYECQTHQDCAAVGHCGSVTLDGQRRTFCVSDQKPPIPGELYTSCPKGDECAEGAVCVGAGPGDLDAYCSIDCRTDDDCAAGYSCGSLTRTPCEDACGRDGVPNDARCVPADQIGDDKPYHCGDLGVQRSVCRQREFCSPCESDADCLGAPNQICAHDATGEKICTRLCDPGVRSCPWGNAGECGNFDAELGVPTCGHRFGSCHGTGKTCEPCRDNADCPGGFCTASSFTGERWCINLDTHCECKNGPDASGTCTGGGCPKSPGGLPLQCVGEETSSLFNICYAANSATSTPLGSSPQTGCWGAN